MNRFGFRGETTTYTEARQGGCRSHSGRQLAAQVSQCDGFPPFDLPKNCAETRNITRTRVGSSRILSRKFFPFSHFFLQLFSRERQALRAGVVEVRLSGEGELNTAAIAAKTSPTHNPHLAAEALCFQPLLLCLFLFSSFFYRVAKRKATLDTHNAPRPVRPADPPVFTKQRTAASLRVTHACAPPRRWRSKVHFSVFRMEIKNVYCGNEAAIERGAMAAIDQSNASRR